MKFFVENRKIKRKTVSKKNFIPYFYFECAEPSVGWIHKIHKIRNSKKWDGRFLINKNLEKIEGDIKIDDNDKTLVFGFENRFYIFSSCWLFCSLRRALGLKFRLKWFRTFFCILICPWQLKCSHLKWIVLLWMNEKKRNVLHVDYIGWYEKIA